MEILEDVAQRFATSLIPHGHYPESLTLTSDDWMAVRLQFRKLRKQYYKLWFKLLEASNTRWPDRRVPTFIVIDEAHNFAPEEANSALQARVSEKIALIAGEGRKYGLFLILATQRPQKLRKGLLAECENACLLRIQSKVERTYAADTLGIARDTVDQQVAVLPKGSAFMHGRWVTGDTTITFGPARTVLGGSGIDPNYWQMR